MLCRGRRWAPEGRWIWAGFPPPERLDSADFAGANFHTIGMYRSKLIVAVNIEENAQIFHIADYCIYADAETVLDGLLAALPDRVFQGEGETEAFILAQLKAYPFRYNPVRKNE